MGELYPIKPLENCKSDPEGKIIDAESLIRKTFTYDQRAGMEMIFRQYYKVLCSHAVRYVSSRAVAEDIVSDILFEFQAKEIHQVIATSYRAYLFTSVRNRAYDHVKKEINRGSAGIDLAMTVAGQNSEQPDSITQFEELHHLIESTVNSMPLKRKQIYIMHRFESKKSKEIAGELHLSRRTIEAHLYKAMQQIQTVLKEHWLWTTVFLASAQLFF